MRVRRHRSFRPTLDVLPGRIAPSSVSNPTAAVAATPTPTPSSDPSYYALFRDITPWTIATQTWAVKYA
jgi:hypothetical protein